MDCSTNTGVYIAIKKHDNGNVPVLLINFYEYKKNLVYFGPGIYKRKTKVNPFQYKFPSKSIYYFLCSNNILLLHHSRSLLYSHANNMLSNIYPKIDR